MLRLFPRSIVRWDSGVYRDAAVAGSPWTETFTESGGLELDGRSYVLGRAGWLSGEFFLADGSGRVAIAEKPSAFLRDFPDTFDAQSLRWHAESAFTRAFVLETDGRRAGALRPSSAFTRDAVLDLPGDVPDELQLFCAWLAILMWRRGRRNS